MKKLFICLSAVIIAITVVNGCSSKDDAMNVKLYFVDSSMQRLIPSDFKVETKRPQKAAKAVISELLKGRDNNPKIMRIMPDINDGLSVSVKGTTAYVNMSSEFADKHSSSRQHEYLTIYSIVNSLTSVDGIVNVRFTIDKKEQKDFKGFCDMRETFIPDYYI